MAAAAAVVLVLLVVGVMVAMTTGLELSRDAAPEPQMEWATLSAWSRWCAWRLQNEVALRHAHMDIPGVHPRSKMSLHRYG